MTGAASVGVAATNAPAVTSIARTGPRNVLLRMPESTELAALRSRMACQFSTARQVHSKRVSLGALIRRCVRSAADQTSLDPRRDDGADMDLFEIEETQHLRRE